MLKNGATRVLDFVNFANRLGIENKVGLVNMSAEIEAQMMQDAQIMEEDLLDTVVWRFQASPITGQIGPSPVVFQMLQGYNIDIILQNPE